MKTMLRRRNPSAGCTKGSVPKACPKGCEQDVHSNPQGGQRLPHSPSLLVVNDALRHRLLLAPRSARKRCPSRTTPVFQRTVKVDLVPDEVERIKAVGTDIDGVRGVLGENDPVFAEHLTDDELHQVAAGLL